MESLFVHLSDIENQTVGPIWIKFGEVAKVIPTQNVMELCRYALILLKAYADFFREEAYAGKNYLTIPINFDWILTLSPRSAYPG